MNRVYCCKQDSVPYDESGRSYYFYPENGIMPSEQVAKAKEIVEAHVRSGNPYTLVTVSPFVLKAIETHSDMLECGEEIEYFGPDGRKTSVQTAFKVFAEPFSKLMRGDHSQAN